MAAAADTVVVVTTIAEAGKFIIKTTHLSVTETLRTILTLFHLYLSPHSLFSGGGYSRGGGGGYGGGQ